MGHITDRTLDNLLDGSIDDASELAIEEHVRHCDRCAHRLREWQTLFPQVRNLMPGGDHAVPAGSAAFAAPRLPEVFIPDWTPPRSPVAFPTRIAWGLVIVLALGAGYLLLQRTGEETPTVGYLPETYQPSSQAASDSVGLGSGIATGPDLQAPSIEALRAAQESALARAAQESTLARAARDSVPVEPPVAEREPPQRQASAPPEESPKPAEQDVRVPSPNREAAVSFPIRVDPSTRQSSRSAQAGGNVAATESLPPLTAQFQRVSLGEAISRLSGTVRLIQGLNPEAVEIAQGSALPGADPAKAVVRVVYNAPEGRLIMDQQRLGRSGGSEPNIAISTAPNGVSVAQWVDRGGFWISLAGRADQQTLLAIANRIR
jgi:anti-sigma factor RsiW